MLMSKGIEESIAMTLVPFLISQLLIPYFIERCLRTDRIIVNGIRYAAMNGRTEGKEVHDLP